MKQPLNSSLTPRNLGITLLLSLLVALPHALHIPILISLYILFIIIWRFTSLRLPKYTPGRVLLALFTITGVLLVYSQHHTLMGRDAGVSLLTLMLALKLMEIRKRRDIYVVVFISYFVVITQFLFSQSFLLALYLLGMLLCLTALLSEINRIKPSRRAIDPLRQTLVITLQAIPIALILFVLFPRLSHPIWQFGLGANSGLTGLSERVSPGSISQLIQSQSVAFRVTFRDQIPPPEKRYWRGLVLWDTDGFDWFNKKKSAQLASQSQLSHAAQPIDYEVLLEPQTQSWLFALDLPASAPPGASLSQDYHLSLNQTGVKLHAYPLRSFMQYRTEEPSPESLLRALELPENVTPQEQALVQSWRNSAHNDKELIQLALQHFNTQPFVYTLAPPLYMDNPTHQFLFEDQEGFCEHYASSFILLMRLAGIPSRMVIGYQGGEYNPMGDYYILRQSDAHAWVEIWLDELGWTRVDPTAAVAPERVRHAIQPQFSALGSPVIFQLAEGGLINSAIKKFGMALDAANIGWRRWIIGYSHERQLTLLRKFGLDFLKAKEWGFFIIALISISLLMIAVRLIFQGRLPEDPVVKSYRKFCQKLAKSGLPRKPNEGPLDYSSRITKLRPKLSQQISAILGQYIKLRYGAKIDKKDILDFARTVKKFRPGQTNW